jgi:hypothetical protein
MRKETAKCTTDEIHRAVNRYLGECRLLYQRQRFLDALESYRGAQTLVSYVLERDGVSLDFPTHWGATLEEAATWGRR